ncbi:ATP-dependent zinc metalloprotease FtsH [Oceanidesulfovibrio marinus]|uniref:ATP-dependent zinc metalloprotease FtsH n=1 Tax=Oceanidesulfovibrio marinus TaxID=370038 RepID=A0A6P1ZG71_9BACT|nr:ATP-dependent zinc metalloprotease FtsH [Oceanidesulfovibrio marinus]TVM31911.1 cell division protein FtsH [Oceanidesulfovibrio marinus]
MPDSGTSPNLKQYKEAGRIWKRFFLAILLVSIVYALYSAYMGPQEPRYKIDYDAFRSEVQNGHVQSVRVQGERIDGVLSQNRTRSLQGNRTVSFNEFYTFLPSFGDDQLMGLLSKNNVAVATTPKQEDGGYLWYAIISLLPFLLIVGLFYYQYKRMRGRAGPGMGIFNIGKSKATLYDSTMPGKTFDDVAGADNAKGELREVITFLKDPEKISRLGGQAPKGTLLVGPPGCGKTLMAKAVAGEAGVPFYSISGSVFMEMFVGVGASRVRDMFQEAKKNAPSIIFIDELDSIGRRRGAGLGGGNDEREQTLNQLLSEMDGFEPNENVVVMSATNRPDILDPALLRPGRFDRRITVDRPTRKARLAILKIHSRKKPLADDVDLDELARSTPGFSGADLENMLNEAALFAARYDRKRITRDDVENARDRVTMGLERKGLSLTDEEKRLIAYHEGGHALAAAKLKHADPLHKISIIPRARSLGATMQLPEDERYIYRKEYLLDRLATMMGGRASEQAVFGALTSGAGSDLLEATRLARKMVLEWGMSDAFSHISLGGEQENVFLGEEIAKRRDYAEETQHEVDRQVQAILDEAYDRARKIVEEHRSELDALVERLLEEEEISGDELRELIGGKKPESPAVEEEPAPAQ